MIIRKNTPKKFLKFFLGTKYIYKRREANHKITLGLTSRGKSN